MSSTIYERNSTNASFYSRHGQMSTLLIHPHGLEVIKFYDKLKKLKQAPLLSQFVVNVAEGLNQVLYKMETEISKQLREVLSNSKIDADTAIETNCTLTMRGEEQEIMCSEIDHATASGHPAVIVCMSSLTRPQSCVHKPVVMIIEVSVDKNGVEKKGQSVDYASLSNDANTTLLLVTLHINRPKDRIPGKVIQEVFLYLHRGDESKKKLGFLWREVYQQTQMKDTIGFLKESCCGIERCFKAARHLYNISYDTTTHLSKCNWNVLSDNVAIKDQNRVYKIFDNRFRSTFRKPDLWLQNEFPWINDIGVEICFYFTESMSNIQSLGRPSYNVANMPYPSGSVLVIQYNYINGTHIASKLSHFVDIANCISKMHDAGIVHGDVRGFNMLHPHPDPGPVGGISKSRMIDFDLCGSPGKDCYPPGYVETVIDNSRPRAGKANNHLAKNHDWEDLLSVLLLYRLSGGNNKKIMDNHYMYSKALESLYDDLLKMPGDGLKFCSIIAKFISIYGDIPIQLDKYKRDEFEEVLIKGAGSPNKLMQASRGSTAVSVASNHDGKRLYADGSNLKH